MRGSNGPKFGEALSASQTADGRTLREIFPSMKFIFPTAKKRRSTILKRIPTNQWFDNCSLEDPSMREHLQVDGLRETTEVVHQIIRDEVSSGISLSNIILRGLSQGCASSIYALLTFDKKLGAYIGMSGWFPFVKYVNESLQEIGQETRSRVEDPDEETFNINTYSFGFEEDEDEEESDKEEESEEEESDEEEENDEEESDEEESEEEEGRDETIHDDGEAPIGAGRNEKTTSSTLNSTNASKAPLKAIKALNFLRENIDFPPIGSTADSWLSLKTLAFLGHGEENEKVSV
ncbi:hypothetical protein TWF102_000322 [Orbilia oligospora]|uniref:Acyl-protein thioesterase 1 n=1 Tax=Orbilia oligospora TaxID=2813651 RepID=A0A7C8NTR7_ORBOL|nr:hypothetical protein TWF102_000322 [Orbilia oligospora]KAF3115980.1 hypothetical protein TWF103_010206 [Orbilia oligospora]KAF3149676.1 hypothetical protein TWF594_010775 [Orbilia oligospora]